MKETSPGEVAVPLSACVEPASGDRHEVAGPGHVQDVEQLAVDRQAGGRGAPGGHGADAVKADVGDAEARDGAGPGVDGVQVGLGVVDDHGALRPEAATCSGAGRRVAVVEGQRAVGGAGVGQDRVAGGLVAEDVDGAGIAGRLGGGRGDETEAANRGGGSNECESSSSGVHVDLRIGMDGICVRVADHASVRPARDPLPRPRTRNAWTGAETARGDHDMSDVEGSKLCVSSRHVPARLSQQRP